MTLKTITHPIDARGPTYIGSNLVYPGESVTVDVPVTDEGAPDTSDPSGARDLKQLQASSIKKIVEVLPHLTLSELEALTELEQNAAQTRTTLIGEIEAEKLKRAAGGE